ncbi:hypothetical protein PI23P_07010 [Polaribacter irgensii 23-P]|uniref:Uncharacterized protein n=1 Tax=Polaribacter irgensii 23-P TaxID=313594 RepID=A4BYW1_9FLAO|nr:hypothetical protein PI23P_07010 [Polaribacter irgensii 23-P]
MNLILSATGFAICVLPNKRSLVFFKYHKNKSISLAFSKTVARS